MGEIQERVAIEKVGNLLDKPVEECGVFGAISDQQGVTGFAYDALRALQHRGQDGAGIALIDRNENITVVKDKGLVPAVFHGGASLQGELDARIALGHVRYATTHVTGDSFGALQPLLETAGQNQLVLAHNGHIKNAAELRSLYDVEIRGGTDSQVLLAALGKTTLDGATIEEALCEILPNTEGSFSLTISDGKRLITARDPAGNRPLAYGRLDGEGWAVASETTALDMIGARYNPSNFIKPGTFMVFENGTLAPTTIRYAQEESARCLMEFAYFSSPDSLYDGVRIRAARIKLGRELAREAPVEADLVIPVPDSGRSASVGFSRESGIPLEEAIFKRHASGRTFIEKGQEARLKALRAKFNIIPELIEGKRIVVVDDSIVRGNTMKTLVSMLREAGAAEIHLRIPSAMQKYSCEYGIDTGNPEELIAANMTVEEMEDFFRVESLRFLSPDGQDVATEHELCKKCMVNDVRTANNTKLAVVAP